MAFCKVEIWDLFDYKYFEIANKCGYNNTTNSNNIHPDRIHIAPLFYLCLNLRLFQSAVTILQLLACFLAVAQPLWPQPGEAPDSPQPMKVA